MPLARRLAISLPLSILLLIIPVACFNAKTGDIEDAPALDGLAVFKVTERDGAVYLSGDKDAIKGGRRQPNFKCAAKADAQEKVVVVGGGSGAIGTVEGL